MATIRAVKKAVTVSPTVRTIPSGVPSAVLIDLNARAPAGHGHGHGEHGPRADRPAKFAGGVRHSGLGLVSKTFVNCKYHQMTLSSSVML